MLKIKIMTRTSKIIGFASIFIMLLLTFSVSGQTSAWIEVAPGVWKMSVGTPDKLDLFRAAEIKPALNALSKLGTAAFPLSADKITAQTGSGTTSLSFPLEKEEKIFGFGLNFKTVYQRGRFLQLHVDHYGGTDNGRTHAPVPFYVTDRGYGVFINSSRYLTIYAGTGVRKDSRDAPEERDRNTDDKWTAQPYSDAVEILVPAGGVEVFIFAGPTMLDAVRRFNLYSGGGCLPPRWGLGFTQRVPRLYTSAQVINEAKLFEEHGFPLDFIGLEPGWQSRSYPCTLEWDSTRFPDPPAFVKTMKEMGIRLNLWTNPYISSRSPIYDKILPFTGSHTVWGGVVPDLTLPGAVEILTDQIDKSQVSIGISGYKIDESDGYDRWLWPDVAQFPSGNSAEQIRQTYGLLLQKITTDLFHRKNQRTFGLTRSSNGGGSSFPYVIYNDYYSHEDFITALINSGFAGVLWTPEVRSSKTGEEWLRRFQTVCFSPMAMINAWSSGTRPWSFPEVEKEVKEYALLRMQLIPYLYSEFAKYHFEGTPPFRGMNLEPGFNSRSTQVMKNSDLGEDPYGEAIVKEIRDQYMAGEYLLVAPLFTGQTTREVVLPEGRWFDFYTGKYAGDGQIIKVTPGLGKIPVFVKDGAIIPMLKPVLHAPSAGQKYDLVIRYYGSAPGFYRLYDDDGETYDYEKGLYSWRDIQVMPDKKGKLKGTISNSEKGKPDNIGEVIWKFMTVN
jgi:alpha-glucosidase (family GH31 glycosyl hydrolase)